MSSLEPFSWVPSELTEHCAELSEFGTEPSEPVFQDGPLEAVFYPFSVLVRWVLGGHMGVCNRSS